jgi:hypothetical protein
MRLLECLRFLQHLNRWKNYFSQLVNVYNVSGVRQTEIYTAETLVPGPLTISIAKLEKHKLSGSDHFRDGICVVCIYVMTFFTCSNNAWSICFDFPRFVILDTFYNTPVIATVSTEPVNKKKHSKAS